MVLVVFTDLMSRDRLTWSIKAVLFLLIKSKVSDCSDKNKSTDMDARCDCKRRRKQIPLGFPIKNAPVAHSPTKFSCFQVYFLHIWLIGHVQYCLHWTPCFVMVCLLFSSLLFICYFTSGLFSQLSCFFNSFSCFKD